MMINIIFVAALPFILFGVGVASFHLGRALVALAVAHWNRRPKKEKDR